MAKIFHLPGPEGLEAIEELLKRTKDLRDKQRLRAIRYGLLGTHTMKGIAEKVGVSRATIGSWSKTFREEGIAAVLRTEFDQRDRKGKVNTDVQELLKKELAEGRFKRAKEVRAWLEGKHGIVMALSGVYYWLGKVGGVLKVPCKTHARQDAVKTQVFKIEFAARPQTQGPFSEQIPISLCPAR